MMIFKKAIPRRAFLRGMGAAVALPWLDGMVPAFAAVAKPALRLGVVYVPNGIIMSQWDHLGENIVLGGPTGGRRVYTCNRRRAKKLIPTKILAKTAQASSASAPGWIRAKWAGSPFPDNCEWIGH